MRSNKMKLSLRWSGSGRGICGSLLPIVGAFRSMKDLVN